jgi:predicted O-methyltransferase YrrM
LKEWIAQLFDDGTLTGMGHLQRTGDLNLGLGWIYYGLARTIRPSTVVVIGSYRGFVPLVLGKALTDNNEGGEVIFIDPSLVDDFWKDPQAVRDHFANYGVTNIRHFLMTTQEFIETDAYFSLAPVGIVFIDGHHSEEQAQFDYEAFEGRLETNGMALFHDTGGYRVSKMYGRNNTYVHRVRDYVVRLNQDARLQVFDVPFGGGLTIVRKVGPEPTPAAPC